MRFQTCSHLFGHPVLQYIDHQEGGRDGDLPASPESPDPVLE